MFCCRGLLDLGGSVPKLMWIKSGELRGFGGDMF